MYYVSAYVEPAFEELDEIFYIVKPNMYYFLNSLWLVNIFKLWINKQINITASTYIN